MSLPVNSSVTPAEASMIAGSVLPIQRAEELLGTLPGVISVRIVASATGAPNLTVAAVVGVPYQSVGKWSQRWRAR